jgi:hypothetical protein
MVWRLSTEWIYGQFVTPDITEFGGFIIVDAQCTSTIFAAKLKQMTSASSRSATASSD